MNKREDQVVRWVLTFLIEWPSDHWKIDGREENHSSVLKKLGLLGFHNATTVHGSIWEKWI